MKSPVVALAVVALLCGAAPALAQLKLPGQKPAPLKPAAERPSSPKPAADGKLSPLDEFILSKFKQFGGVTLCLEGDGSLADIRSRLAEHLKVSGVGTSPTIDEVTTALWTRFPCPFYPVRSGFRPATATDIEGVWLFPEASQPYRFGPKSPHQPASPSVATKCETVGYLPGGEYRTIELRGTDPCVFRTAKDIEPARARPAVAAWSLPKEGRVRIERKDARDREEEWDIYVATEEFEGERLLIRLGDLVAFLRKSKGNEINAATEFRHLQRLQ